MKHIVKGRPPAALRDWARTNAKLPGAAYGSHNFPKEAVKRALLQEQGSICAYTMVRIGDRSSHIEHLKPQTVSRAEGTLHETFDYRNMVACYPATPKPGEMSVTFGAIRRGCDWDETKFIAPLNAKCEDRLRFLCDGRVLPRREDDAAATWTIETLRLRDSTLTELRRAAINGWGLSLSAKNAASRADAERILGSITGRDRDGVLHPFCVAIRDAAVEYIHLLDRAAARRKYAGRSKRGR
jgi:uncharacterized protein (TIGR02646 family)